MTHASLFSGIGGFDLAAEQLGWQNLFYCEWDTFCQKVLGYHFPNSVQYADIKTTDFNEWRGRVDVLSGGFPCQPFSCAGQRKGTEDDRYLWPEMLRAIEEIRPTWVVGENVTGLLSMAQPSEVIRVEKQTDLFGQSNLLLEEESSFVLHNIYEDFEARGYDVQSFIIPACAVGAPHRRDRLWIVAHAFGRGVEDTQRKRSANPHTTRPSTHPCSEGSHRRNGTQLANQYSPRFSWDGVFPTKSPFCRRDDGFPTQLDGITIPRWRKESLKAYGNAIVPEVARRIFEAIEKIENSIYE